MASVGSGTQLVSGYYVGQQLTKVRLGLDVLYYASVADAFMFVSMNSRNYGRAVDAAACLRKANLSQEELRQHFRPIAQNHPNVAGAVIVAEGALLLCR